MGQVLLEEMSVFEVRDVMKQMRRNDDIPLRLKDNLKVVARIAKRHIKLTEHLAGFSGKYKESFPSLARGICKTFYADDLELAACFGVTERTIRTWKVRHPDFNKGIKYGKSSFTKHGGSFVLYRRWFGRTFGKIANNICRQFNPSKRQLVRCFAIIGLKTRTLDEWRGLRQNRFVNIRDRAFLGVVHDICVEFNPNDEQLAHCLGTDFNRLKEWMETDREFSDSVRRGRVIASGAADKIMEGVERSMASSTEQSGNAIDNEDQEKESCSEQRENSTDSQALQE